MGWNTEAEIREKLELAKKLVAEYGDALTWEQAEEAVLLDTVELAAWGGLRKSGLSPCEALKRLKHLAWRATASAGEDKHLLGSLPGRGSTKEPTISSRARLARAGQKSRTRT